MAKENTSWGYDRIQGALANLGHIVASNTVKNILKRHGIEPAPEREKRTSWKGFLKAHWEVMAATDFFTIEVWSTRGLATYYVLFLIHLSTRFVYIAGVTTAERFVRSIKEECLDRIILFGEASLRRALREYVEHYHGERNHQGVGNRLLEPPGKVGLTDNPIHCRKRLGDMLNFYYREAA
jgi:hypothetical protein